MLDDRSACSQNAGGPHGQEGEDAEEAEDRQGEGHEGRLTDARALLLDRATV